MKVKTINGPLIENYHYENWLVYWKNHSGEPALYCSEYNCLCSGNLIGTHVKKMNRDNTNYIIPLCPVHHTKNQEIHVNDHTKFVALQEKDVLKLT
ncbi:MAG: hypothetical protein J5I47_02665 [Vicingus serpentipes]|nr:hypothetical protein [Vicingus serpentipes]